MSRYRFEKRIYGLKKGFFCIELLVGIAILTIFALAVGHYLACLSHDQIEGKNRLKAVSIARTTLEKLCVGKQETIEQEEPFIITWKQIPLAQVPFSHVQVTVSWQGEQGMHSVTLDSGVQHELS